MHSPLNSFGYWTLNKYYYYYYYYYIAHVCFYVCCSGCEGICVNVCCVAAVVKDSFLSLGVLKYVVCLFHCVCEM